MKIVIVDEARFCGWLIPKLHAVLSQDTFEEANYLATPLVTAWRDHPPDVVVLSRHAQGIAHEKSLEDWVEHIATKIQTRIVLITESIDPPGDKLMRVCADVGVNDVVQGDPIGAEQIAEIADVIKNPRGSWAMAPYRHSYRHDDEERTTNDTKRQAVGNASYFKRRPKLGMSKSKDASEPSIERVSNRKDLPTDSTRHPQKSVSYAVRQIIAVQGLGGGVGATMIAAQLARALTSIGRVLLLDWDSRGAIQTWLGEASSKERCWEATAMPDVTATKRWATRVWNYDDHLDVLTSNGHYPERTIELSIDETNDLLRWGQRQYDYVVVDLGTNWANERCALTTAMADCGVLVTGLWDYHQALALHWQQWCEANEWLVAERHLWVATGHGVTKQQRRQWERTIGERLTTVIDYAEEADSQPIKAIMAAATTRAEVGILEGDN